MIEEKILTMSYEKSIMIKTLPADFTVLVRDYSRQQGNGVELWLIQNKTFDYKGKIFAKFQMPETFIDDNFIVWRIGDISSDELNIPEKADEISNKLAEEINRHVSFKSTAALKDASVPKKFVFNPLMAVRQNIMVVENKAIGESIMVGLSGLMPDCNIMTRDSWKTIFTEQNLIREQGERLDNDISGTVLISGWVWQENNKKQYLFNLTDIRTGICVGSLQCSGNVEDVAAQLADTCKKIKLAVSVGNNLTVQTKQELDHEHWKIRHCFTTRFKLGNTDKMNESLILKNREISKPEFAAKQWKLGNRENAIEILEEIWRKDKSSWGQLKKYYCEMGNYTRALEIVETILQQENASSSLIQERYRLRALIASNAKPPARVTTQFKDEPGAPVSKKRRNSGATYEDYFNWGLEDNYFKQASARGMEWNPDGECRSYIKRQLVKGLKYEKWIQENAVQPSGVRINIFEIIGNNISWQSEAMWESLPLFGNDDTMALSRMVKLLGGGDPSGVSGNEPTNQIEGEPFSMVRALFSIVKNPEMKLTPVVEKIKESVTDYGDTERWERNKAEAECDSGEKFLELYFKTIMRNRKIDFGRIRLSDLICIDIAARHGNPEAQDMLCEINAIELPASSEKLRSFKFSNFDIEDLLIFKVYRGDRDACELALKSLRGDYSCMGHRYDGGYGSLKDVYYLMAKAGRKEIIIAMLQTTDCKENESIAAIRWGNKKMLKSLLLEHPELFEMELYLYLVDGLNDPEFCEYLFNNRHILQNNMEEYLIKSALWLGKPISEIFRDLTLNYKRKD